MHWKTSLGLLGAGAIALVLSGWLPPAVEAGNPPGKQRHLTRSKTWISFRNTGTMGRRNDIGRGGGAEGLTDPDLSYPGTKVHSATSGGDPNDWIWGSWYPNLHSSGIDGYNCALGQGVWILTREPGSYNVSSSNPRYETVDIAPMVYDAAGGPEASLGVDDGRSNYYPGAAPPIEEPVEIHNYAGGKYMDANKDHFPEEIIVSKWTTERGITVTRKAYAWSYPDYDDFVIVEHIFENTGDANGDGIADSGLPVQLNDTYFVFVNSFAVAQAGHVSRFSSGNYGNYRNEVRDDWFVYTGAPNYSGPHSAAKMAYQWDGDSPFTTIDDTGEPFSSELATRLPAYSETEGELMAFQYVGVAPLDYTPPFANDPGEIYIAPKQMEQPFAGHWWEAFDTQNSEEPTNQVNSDQEIYEAFTAPNRDNPSEVKGLLNSQTYGPYDLGPGDKAKIVLAYVLGSGAEAQGMDLYEWAIQGRQDQLAAGEQALFNHLSRAQFAYDNGFDIPDAPPDVAFTVESNPQGNLQLSWRASVEQSPNPDYGTADIAGYRVYQSSVREIGPWTLLEDIPVGDPNPNTPNSSLNNGIYTYADTRSAAGFEYWYAVTTYASGKSSWTNGISTMSNLSKIEQDRLKLGLESGKGGESQRTPLSKVPFVPSTDAKDQLQDLVRVVPNPFRADDVHKYSGSDRVRFVNVPRKARINVFSLSGDLVAQFEHDGPDRGEVNWRLLLNRSVTGPVSSGIYYFVVESLVSPGQTQSGTFVIIK